MGKRENNAQLHNILHSGYSGTLVNNQKSKVLLDFHVLDNGNVYYRFWSYHAKCEGTADEVISAFEDEFGIDLKVFLK